MGGKDLNPPYTDRPEFENPDTQVITLSRSMYAAGSVGYEIFPDILEGRQRPIGFVTAPLANTRLSPYSAHIPVPQNFRGRIADNLNGLGIQRMSDILNMDLNDFHHLPVAIRNQSWRLTNVFMNSEAAVGPEGRLFEYTYGSALVPVSVEADNLRQPIVKNALSDVSMTPREKRILTGVYGIDDGHYHTLEQIAESENVTQERIRQIEQSGAAKMRHGLLYEDLKPFITFGKMTFPLAIGGNCRYDLYRKFPRIDFERSRVIVFMTKEELKATNGMGTKVNFSQINDQTTLMDFFDQVRTHKVPETVKDRIVNYFNQV